MSETRRPRPGAEPPAGSGARRPVAEGNPIRITLDDVTRANQLSLNCPICAGPVERNVPTTSAAPVVCTECGTLYHRACWESGGKCAMIGCDSTSMRLYGEAMGPVLTIRRSDLDRVPPGYRNKQLKAHEVRTGQPQKQRSFWSRLFRRILESFR